MKLQTIIGLIRWRPPLCRLEKEGRDLAPAGDVSRPSLFPIRRSLFRILGAAGRDRAQGGFTLMEMIGVLALMAMTTAVLTPNLAVRLSRANAAREDRRIDAISDALIRYAARYQQIPGVKTWASKVAPMLGLPTREVLHSIPDDPSTARVILFHPDFNPSMARSGPLADPVWMQGIAGTSRVSDARALIVSVHRAGLALPVTSGVAASRDAFESLWEWTLDPSLDAPPEGWPAEWQGNGEYLHVGRISFEALFHRVTFSNTQFPKASPFLQVGDQPATALASTPTYDALYLEGTCIRLYEGQGGIASPGLLQLNHTVREGVNFVYADNYWRIP